VSTALLTGVALSISLAAFAAPALRFLRTPTRAGGKQVEVASGLWTLASYILLGIVPLLVP
jgi:hypothetical protein